MGVTREEFIANACADLFWTHMARPVEKRVPLATDSANSLVVATICNRQVGWEAAMRVVPELKKRSGTRNTLAIITSPRDDIERWMFSPEYGKSLHRYRYMADLIGGLGLTIRDQYHGDIRNMWTADDPLKVPSYSQLLERIKAIKGFGDKTGTMLIRMLVLVYAVELFDGLQGLLPSDDRHVRRVGSRLELWDEDAPFATICEVSRRLCPCCPAEMDSLFILGTDFCAANRPECGSCGLSRVCPSHRR